MPLSESRRRANKKSDDKYWEYCTVKVHKGRKAEIKAAAGAKKQSVNKFINEAIDAAMEPLRDVWDKPNIVLKYKGKDTEFNVIDTKKSR